MALTTTARTARALHPAEIDWAAWREVYPESDGQPMSDNTKQLEYMFTIVGGLQALFRNEPDVFVAGDLLWYPVDGEPRTRLAPDALVVFGRPKGHRGSYLQFLEGDIPPQVVFEILSPKNSAAEMARKRAFYERYGVEEYYEYDPDRGLLRGWMRQDERLTPIPEMRGWISARLAVRFELDQGELRLIGPDGQPFESYVELVAQREQERDRAEQERDRAERLAARLRALGVDPDEV